MQWMFVLQSSSSSAHKNIETLRRRSEGLISFIILNQFPSWTTVRYKTGPFFIDCTIIFGITPRRKWPLQRPRRRCEWSMKVDQWGIQEVKMGWSTRERFKYGNKCYWCAQHLASVNYDTRNINKAWLQRARNVVAYLLITYLLHGAESSLRS
jgi:hypothetical protein